MFWQRSKHASKHTHTHRKEEIKQQSKQDRKIARMPVKSYKQTDNKSIYFVYYKHYTHVLSTSIRRVVVARWCRDRTCDLTVTSVFLLLAVLLLAVLVEWAHFVLDGAA